MKSHRAYPYIILLLGAAVLCGLLIMYVAREVSISNHKFCAVVKSVAQVPAPKPSDSAQHQSEERSYVLYQEFVKLQKDLGC